MNATKAGQEIIGNYFAAYGDLAPYYYDNKAKAIEGLLEEVCRLRAALEKIAKEPAADGYSCMMWAKDALGKE